jgi:hypothetical protein
VKKIELEDAAPALREAMRALKARKGPADYSDRPLRRPWPSKVLPGQMDVYEALEETECEQGEEEGDGTP